MSRLLFAWLGDADLAARRGKLDGMGPIASALRAREFDELVLLSTREVAVGTDFSAWIAEVAAVPTKLRPVKIDDPTDYAALWRAAVAAVEAARERHGDRAALTYHLSPGTSPMAATWILLSHARYPAELIQSSPEAGVETVHVPFEIAAEFIPAKLRQADRRLEEAATGPLRDTPELRAILYRSPQMKQLMQRAARAAVRDVPVLLQGESGTGKELLARAIASLSPRAGAPFRAVNCGALPESLLESTLFGHIKGAFTGADRDQKGLFEAADGGTLFLDEVGELSPSAQARLLRVLQEGEVIPVGTHEPRRVDVRIVAATHRDLLGAVGAGRFRDDLFYRLAVAVLNVPPLRQREGDLGLLIDHLLAGINEEGIEQPGYEARTLSAAARRRLLAHPWPGNVRELANTLTRAAIWSADGTLTEPDIEEAILPVPGSGADTSLLDRPLGEQFSLDELTAEIWRHYLRRALEQTAGNKSAAARLLGLGSYQRLDYWLDKYDVEV